MLQHTQPPTPSVPSATFLKARGTTGKLVLAGLLVALAATPSLAADPTAEVGAAESASDSDEVAAAKMFAGTSILWRNVTSTQTFDPSLAQTYNPYFAMAAQFRFQVWPVAKKLFVATTLGLNREFTQSDTTTEADETLLGDLRLTVGSPSFVQIPEIEVDLGASLTLTLPTSKRSQFQSLQIAVSPSLTISKTFEDALAGMTLSYTIAGTFFAHEFTTGGFAAEGTSRCGNVGLSPGELQSSSCLNSGVRNVQVRMVNTLNFGLAFIPELGLSLGVSFIHDFLYPQEEASTGGANFEPTAERSIRHAMAYSVEVWTRPWKPLKIAVGVEDLNSLFDSNPEDAYRHPFDPFTTAFYLDFRLDLAQLAIAFME